MTAEEFLVPTNIVEIVDTSMLMTNIRCLPSAKTGLETHDVRVDTSFLS